jgi:hypothetical protein
MRLLCLLTLLSICTVSLFAQAGAGTITGIISDPTGAVIAGAPIEAKNVDTGAVYRATSTETGNYTLPQLPAGRYELSLSVMGFKKYDRQNLSLAVTQVMRLDIALEVGSNAETVTVSAEASLLKTENSELAHNVTVSQMQNLPILSVGGNGGTATSGVRNPWAMVQLIPGTQFVSNSSMSINGSTTSYSIRVEGQDANMNDANVIYTQRVQPSVDAIQEVSVQTSNYAAEFGTVGGGIFNVTMKSGTNQYHGNLYDYAVNEVLNAHQPYTGARTAQKRHDYGGTLGGPVRIPKLYNGENRTFFFWSFEQFRENALITAAPTAGFPTVPIPEYRNGDFNPLILSYGQLVNGVQTPRTIQQNGKDYVDQLGRTIFSGAIFDPKTERPVPGTSVQIRDQFPNNRIPQTAAYLDPVAQKVLALIPLPKGVPSTQLGQNYQNPWITHRTTEIPSLKVDQQFGAKGHFSGYYGLTGTESQFSSPNGNMEGFPAPITAARGTFIHSRTIRLNYDHTLTPTMLLHVGVGYWNEDFDDHAPTTDYDAEKELGLRGATLKRNFPNFVFNPPLTNPSIAQGGQSNLSTTIQSVNFEQKPSANLNLSWVHRNHTAKIGGEWRATGYPNYGLGGTNGSYTFLAGPTSQSALQGVSGLTNNNTGFPLATFLLGDVTAATLSAPVVSHTGQQQYALFVQDTWKVTRKLTVDAGLRWDYGTYRNETYGRFGNFSPTTPNPSAGGRLGATIYEATCNCNFASNYPYAIGPRLGVAYQINSKTVFRAGFGIVYSPTSNASGSATSSANAGTPETNKWLFQLKDGMPPAVRPVWPAFDPANAQIPGTIVTAPTFLDPNAGRPARQYQWSAGLQRELSRNFVVEATYVANRVVWNAGTNTLTSLNAISAADLAKYGFTDFTNANDASLLTATISTLTPAQRSNLAARGVNLTPYAGFPSTQIVRQALFPYPQFSVTNGAGITPSGAPLGKVWYDSLQATITKRLSHGLSLNANYTYSKTLDLNGSPDIFNRSLGKDLANNDLPHQFRLSAEYTSPKLRFGVFQNKILSYVFSDWGMGWFLQYQSAVALARPTNNTTIPISQFLGRSPGSAQLIAGQPLYSTDWTDLDGKHHTDELDINCHCYDPTKTIVLNPKAWENIPNGVFGAQQTVIRQFRGVRQPLENVNFSRNFRIRERMSFQMRVEFTNAFNRARWGTTGSAPVNVGNYQSNPSTTPQGLYSAGFGTIVPATGTANFRTGLLIGRLVF